MNSKKAGLAFLLLIVLQCIVTAGMIVYFWMNPIRNSRCMVIHMIWYR